MNTKQSRLRMIVSAIALLSILSACAPRGDQPASAAQTAAGPQQPLRILAAESFLADIAQNVAGERVKVDSLMPLGIDPHAFEPTPADVAKIAQADIIVVNGAGFEEWLQKTLESAGGKHTLVEASAGLNMRTPAAGEHPAGEEHHDGDPHFWLDPLNVIAYVENIRAALSQADPAGKDAYTKNAAAYTRQLKELDDWIQSQVKEIPAERRLLVTNHESLGYYADHYGFKVIGTLIPSVSTSASPSAQELAALVDAIKATHAPAIFLETGANPALGEQAAQEAGVKLVTGLYTHSLTLAGGDAPTYLDMMKYNTSAIVKALK